MINHLLDSQIILSTYNRRSVSVFLDNRSLLFTTCLDFCEPLLQEYKKHILVGSFILVRFSKDHLSLVKFYLHIPGFF